MTVYVYRDSVLVFSVSFQDTINRLSLFLARNKNIFGAI